MKYILNNPANPATNFTGFQSESLEMETEKMKTEKEELMNEVIKIPMNKNSYKILLGKSSNFVLIVNLP